MNHGLPVWNHPGTGLAAGPPDDAPDELAAQHAGSAASQSAHSISQENGVRRSTPCQDPWALGSSSASTAFRKKMFTVQPLSAEEERALSAGTATEGGYLYADEQFMNELIADVTDATIMRQVLAGIKKRARPWQS